MKINILFLLISLVVFNGGRPIHVPSYKDSSLPVEERVEDLLIRMTLEEKIELLGGTGFETKAIERLEIPSMNMTDGPVGVRWNKSTSFPSGISLAAAWDTSLAERYGTAIARETKGKGRHVILGPCVNIARVPHGGRNFESFGEDPFLTSRLAVNYIKGVQKEDVAATIKHFACNNQEFQRMFIDVKADERALNEIYLPSFKAAVLEANVLAVMSAYNKLNGAYCSQNDYLLIKKLKEEWVFKGLVMSDWGAVHSSLPTVKSGLDLEMPTGQFINKELLLKAIEDSIIDESIIDDKVRRILRVMFTIGLFDNQAESDKTVINSKEHQQFAFEVALKSIVLLKNDNSILPLNKNKIKSIAVIGHNSATARTGGGGSSFVEPFYSVSPLEALTNKLNGDFKISYAQGISLGGDTNPINAEFFYQQGSDAKGIKAEYFNNKNLQGKPVILRIDEKIDFDWSGDGPAENLKDNFSARWITQIESPKSGEFVFDVTSDDGVRLYINDKLVIDDWINHAPYTNSYKINLVKGKKYDIKLEYYEDGGGAVVKFGWRQPDENLFEQAVNIAKNSDAVILFAGTSNNFESEGFDRPDLLLPGLQDALIETVTEVNNNVIVVLNTGSAVLMNKWIDKIDGLLEIWFGGEQIGNAIADVLSGSYNPSGKLPVTFPVKWEDCSAHNSYKVIDSITNYDDGIFIGYRHFDKNNIKPLFPFGYGLSYTTFVYSNLTLSSSEILKDEVLNVSLDIKNSGTLEGEEVVQLYVQDVESSFERPVKELKGFSKINLKPGEVKNIKFKVDHSALSFYNDKELKWDSEKGEFKILIGSSSEDIKLEKTFTLK